MNDEQWEKVSFIQMAPNRKKALKELSESSNPLTPTEIGDRLEIAFNSAGRSLRQLESEKLVECVNPSSPRYRRYRITDEGRKIIDKVKEIEE